MATFENKNFKIISTQYMLTWLIIRVYRLHTKIYFPRDISTWCKSGKYVYDKCPTNYVTKYPTLLNQLKMFALIKNVN